MILKIKHLLQRLGKEIKLFFPDVKEFGFKVALYRAVDFLFPRPKTKAYINALSDYMEKELSPLTEKYKNGYIPENPKKLFDMNGKIPVFVCWWQGEDKMPPLVSACVARMKKKIPQNAQLHIITEKNYSQYVTIPGYVLDKFKSGKITLVHFTDILRYALTFTYGGMWIDSTVYLSNDFKFNFLDKNYHTQRFSSPDVCPHEACMGKWCNFFFCGKRDNILFGYVYEALLLWWKNHDKLLEYIIIDYIIRSGYFGVVEIQNLVDGVEPNNEKMWMLSKKLNDEYNEGEFNDILNMSGFFKLSFKADWNTKSENGNKTVYAHIIGGENV